MRWRRAPKNDYMNSGRSSHVALTLCSEFLFKIVFVPAKRKAILVSLHCRRGVEHSFVSIGETRFFGVQIS